MKKKLGLKVLSLSAVVALCFSLTACYVPADDVSGDTDTSLDNQTLPWQTMNPVTASPVPTYEPLITTAPQQLVTNAPVVIQQATPSPTIGSYSVNTATSAPAVTPTLKAATPTATTFLYKRGSSGSTVKTIQQRLKDLGYYTGSVDGSFGASTETAVKNFQKTNGLTADGVVGSSTYAKLTSSSALKAGSTPTPKAITTLKQGSTGSSVRTVQQRLKALGYYTGSVDGSYGASTTAAVKAFQRRNGLTVDGKVGTTTWARLNSSSAISATATATPAASGVLKLGSTGAAVKAVQTRLKALGYFTGKADGVYGTTTETAVKAFQKRNGLTVDGQVGSGTLAKLNSSSAKAAEGFATATPTAKAKATATPRPSSIVAQKGDDNDTVKGIQQRLKELGYFTTSATGYYGTVTEDAVKQFQKNNGLTVTGIVDTKTQTTLNSSKAKGAGGATAKPTATPIAKQGSEGTKVTEIQNRLKTLGYFTAEATGHYGSVTAAAVKAFQKANGLTETGIVDKTTYETLMSSRAVAKSTATPKPTATPNANVIAKKGDTSALVSTIQSRLKDLGYFTDAVTEYYGSKTESAVKAFQKANGLADTGTCDQTTYNLLMSSRARGQGTATPKPTSTPSSAVIAKKGDSNAVVTEIQNRLIKLGYLEGTATGSYGSATATAVKAFQKANNLSDTGICDQVTYNLLLSNRAKAKATATPKPTPTANPNVIAKRGDKNAVVTAIQDRLIVLGYMSGSSDGSYGSTTEAAVKAFQKANGLAATGTCDQLTYNTMMSSKAKAKTTATPTATPTVTPSSTIVAKPGDRGETVMSIQERLKTLGYFSGTTTELYGSKTKQAVIDFQARNGLPQTGIVDKTTYTRLNSSKAVPKNTATPTPTATPNTKIIAKKGDSNDVVVLIQTKLAALGYFTNSVTGNYGSATVSAVKDFQRVNGLADTGSCDQVTYNLLISGKAKSKPTVTGKPTSTPRTDVYWKQGNTGTGVTKLQTRLIELGYLSGKATGNFGGATTAAVYQFQKDHNLWADGIAGPNTLTRLYGSSAKRAGSICGVIGVTLKSGDQGAEVTALQRRLRSLGYLTTSANGSYGEKTVEAVKNFQQANGLPVTGIANQATLNAIFEPTSIGDGTGNDSGAINEEEQEPVASATMQPVSAATAQISIGGYSVLREGSKGDDVKALQVALKAQGYLSANATGNYGSKTVAAVKSFQKANGLRVTGVAGPATQRMLFGTTYAGASTALGDGSTGTDVAEVQYTLYELGFYEGKINGIYGQSTVDAVVAYQQAAGISPSNGTVGSKTRTKIYSASPLQ